MSYVSPASITALGSVLPILGIVAVGLRFYIRKQHKQGLKADDWLILPALLFDIGIGACLLCGVAGKALGYPSENTSPTPSATDILNSKLSLAAFVLQAIGLTFAKLSILCFYRRIFLTGSNKRFNIFTKVLFVIIVLWGVTWAICFLSACGNHFSAFWASWQVHDEYCSAFVVQDSFFVAADLVVDVILFIIPIPLIARLKISRSRRFAITFVFCLGTLTVVTTLIRLIFVALLYEGWSSSLSSSDQFLIVSDFLYWTMLETGLAVIVACLPTFQIVFRSFSTDVAFRHVRGFVSIMSFSNRSTTRKSRDTAGNTSSNESLHLDKLTVRGKTEHYTADPEV